MLLALVLLTASGDTLTLHWERAQVQFLRKNWLSVASIRPQVRFAMGSFRFAPHYGREYFAQIDTFWQEGDTAVVLEGTWKGLGRRWRWRAAEREGILFWHLESDSGNAAAVRLRWLRFRGEYAYGLGAQCVPGPLDGRRYRLWTEEQGIGRGKQP
ncbi:MAG: hypothetical protein NZZ60_02785, partial [Bacteroidia bacterium]|nr:hypothetical protein [Bacteroidia bacterium]